MTNEEMQLQVLGTNTEAQEIVTEILTQRFPELESEYDISAQIIDKYYDYGFYFCYTADGGGARRWRTMVTSYCAKNRKLYALEEFFNASGTTGTQYEEYSGEDTTTNTDNREQVNKVNFNAIGQTNTSGLSNEDTQGFTQGKNTFETLYARGTRRTWTDGRTWTEILSDIENATEPVYDFINGFVRLLRAPCDCECLPPLSPSVAAKIGQITTVSPDTPASANVSNIGTLLNALFKFDFSLPKGEQGEQGEQGERGEQGLPGQNGADGEPPLYSLGVLQSDYAVADLVNSDVPFDGNKFSKLLSPNSASWGIFWYKKNGDTTTYLIIARILMYGNKTFVFSFADDFFYVKYTTEETTPLYMHFIQLTQTVSGSQRVFIVINYLSHKSTGFKSIAEFSADLIEMGGGTTKRWACNGQFVKEVTAGTFFPAFASDLIPNGDNINVFGYLPQLGSGPSVGTTSIELIDGQSAITDKNPVKIN